jgi:hypothetical protein
LTSPADSECKRKLDDALETCALKRKIDEALESYDPEQGYKDNDLIQVILNPKKRELLSKWDESWNEMFEKLERFKKQYGHCKVPVQYPEDPGLGAWISAQRSQVSKMHSACVSILVQEHGTMLMM